MSLSPVSQTIAAGTDQYTSVSVMGNNGDITQINARACKCASNTGCTWAEVTNCAAGSTAPSVETLSWSSQSGSGWGPYLWVMKIHGVAPGAAATGASARVNGGWPFWTDNCSRTGTVVIIPPPPWEQVQGGDVVAKGRITSPMTSSVNPRVFNLNGDGGYPGIVSYGWTGAAPYDFDAGSLNGGNYVSSTNWLINEPGDGTVKDPFVIDWYQYFLYQFDLSPLANPTPDYTLPLNTITKPARPPNNGKAYYVTGDMETSGDWVIAANEKIVFLVDGDATIKGKITITPGGFFALIANGNIIIDSSVGVPYTSSTPVVEGIYITNPTGAIETGASVLGTERFVGKGMFVAGNFVLQRDLQPWGRNTVASAELFIYNPQLLFTMPQKMQDLKIHWQEVAP